jgi:DNA-binding PadR family transcriptional regulator
MSAISGNQLRGHLDSLLLAALERGAAHGWEICRRLEHSAGPALRMKEGSVYPSLYRLERQRLVAARWEAGESGRRGPRRRIYRLTPKGRRRLAAARGEWREFTAVIGALLGAPA